MEIIKIIGVALTGVIMVVIIKQYKPEFSIYISLATSFIIIFLFIDKLSGIVNFINNFSEQITGSREFLKILIKITGIAILTEFAVRNMQRCWRKCNWFKS